MKKINQLFNEKIVVLTDAAYDPTDVSETKFGDDLQRFMKHFQSMERRLVSILQTAIESSINLEQAISCFEVFSEVLNENLLKGLALKSFQGFNL